MAKSGMNPILSLAVRPGVAPLHAGLFVSPGWGRHPDRIADSWEIIVVERGRLGLAVGEVDHDLGPGDWVLMPKGVRHHGTRDYPRDLRFAWLHFSLWERFLLGEPQQAASPNERAFGAAPLARMGGVGRSADAKKIQESEMLVLPGRGHLRDPALVAATVRRAIAQSLVMRPDPIVGGLLIALVLAELAASPASASSPTDAAGELADRALRFVRERFREAISTATVARALGVSADHLGRCFRRAHGGTVVEAINRCRLEEAQRLMLLGGGRIADVAQAAGFPDPQWLRRLLRRQHGIGPRAWRRLHTRVHVNTA